MVKLYVKHQSQWAGFTNLPSPWLESEQKIYSAFEKRCHSIKPTSQKLSKPPFVTSVMQLMSPNTRDYKRHFKK